MSFAARWSYTSTATLWPYLGRDDWTGQISYGAPQTFACDYSAESMRMTDAKGVEFTTRQILFTELATAKQGDMVLIGESAEASPIAAGALEVRAVTRYADTFENAVDDFKIVS